MNDITNDLPEAIRHQADRILRDIEHAGSMIVIVESGARANGFVLGIMCSGGLPTERCESLSMYFDDLVEKRLRLLALGL